VIIGIVIGIDRTGKTPLIELMRQVDPSIVRHQIVDSPNEWRALSKAGREVERWLIASGIWVYDRFPYPDEFVYGDNLKRPDFAHWERRFERSGATVKIVYVEPNDLTGFQRRAAEDPDAHFDMTNMDVVLDHIGKYKVWLTQTTLPVMRVSCDRRFVIGDGRRVVEWLKRPM
jgi:hypothetical protein